MFKITSDSLATFRGVASVIEGLKKAVSNLIQSVSGIEDRVDALQGNAPIYPLATDKGGTGLSTIGTAGQVLTVNAGATALEYQTPSTGSSGWQVIVKPTNETRVSTTTLADDTDLKFTMDANTVYAIRIHVFYTLENTGGNFKFGINGPSGATLVRTQAFRMAAGSSSDSTSAVEAGYAWSRGVSTGAITSDGKVRLYIIVQNGATAGTFAFQWAQNTSDVDDTIVYAGSTLEYAQA